MNTIVINNNKFEFNLGCRLLKLKYAECPFPELQDIWNDIEPLTFEEISTMENLEHRRIGIDCLGLERLASQVNPTLISSETIEKKTTWVNENGELRSIDFSDTYELFRVDGSLFNKGLQRWQSMEDAYFIRCKDTSTNRTYLLWVNIDSVYRTNFPNDDRWGRDLDYSKLDSIHAIAWTIQTNIPKGKIEKIVRQGDCILIKPKPYTQKMREWNKETERHLTKEEYLELLVAES